MDLENKAMRFIYQRLKELILRHKMDGAGTIAKAIKVLFPRESEFAIWDLIFGASSDHYRNKHPEKITRNFNHLMNECYRFDILSSSRGAEFYRL